MKKIAISILTFFVLIQPAFANSQADVEKLVTEKISAVVSLIQDKTLDKKIRNKKIIKLVKPIFDFKLMARLSVGKKSWKEMSKSQQKDFTLHFTDRLQESFLEKLDLYTNEKVEYGQAKAGKRKRFEMPVWLLTKDDKIELLFKLYKTKKKGWNLYDLEIIGVSVVQTYRSQFSNELKKGSIGDLIAKLGRSGGFKIQTEEKKK